MNIIDIIALIIIVIFWIIIWVWMFCLIFYLGCDLHKVKWNDLNWIGKFIVTVVRLGNTENKE